MFDYAKLPKDYDVAYKFTAKMEGGISDDKNDRGGKTRYGVSYALFSDLCRRDPEFLRSIGLSAIQHGHAGVKPEHARKIFYHEFWALPGNKYYDLNKIPLANAVIIFDAAVNHGRGRSVKFFQKAYNQIFPTQAIADDGLIGPKTIEAAQVVSQDVIDACLKIRMEYFKAIVKNDPSQKCFLKGWLNRANALQEYMKETFFFEF